MRKRIIEGLMIIAAAGIVYYGANLLGYQTPEPPETRADLTAEETIREINRSINLISPVPPASESWIVEQIDFVERENKAYVNYHDTRNIFRILISTESLPFKTAAVYEAESANPLKWKLAKGGDSAKDKELTSYIFDPDDGIWTKKE